MTLFTHHLQEAYWQQKVSPCTRARAHHNIIIPFRNLCQRLGVCVPLCVGVRVFECVCAPMQFMHSFLSLSRWSHFNLFSCFLYLCFLLFYLLSFCSCFLLAFPGMRSCLWTEVACHGMCVCVCTCVCVRDCNLPCQPLVLFRTLEYSVKRETKKCNAMLQLQLQRGLGSLLRRCRKTWSVWTKSK